MNGEGLKRLFNISIRLESVFPNHATTPSSNEEAVAIAVHQFEDSRNSRGASVQQAVSCSNAVCLHGDHSPNSESVKK